MADQKFIVIYRGVERTHPLTVEATEVIQEGSCWEITGRKGTLWVRHLQTLSNNGAEGLVLEIRRDDCTNWCQQVAEWLKADIDEEIRVSPKRRITDLSGPVSGFHRR